MSLAKRLQRSTQAQLPLLSKHRTGAQKCLRSRARTLPILCCLEGAELSHFLTRFISSFCSVSTCTTGYSPMLQFDVDDMDMTVVCPSFSPSDVARITRHP